MRTILGFAIGVGVGVYLSKWLNTEKGMMFQEQVFAKASQIFGGENVQNWRESVLPKEDTQTDFSA